MCLRVSILNRMSSLYNMHTHTVVSVYDTIMDIIYCAGHRHSTLVEPSACLWLRPNFGCSDVLFERYLHDLMNSDIYAIVHYGHAPLTHSDTPICPRCQTSMAGVSMCQSHMRFPFMALQKLINHIVNYI